MIPDVSEHQLSNNNFTINTYVEAVESIYRKLQENKK